MLPKRRKASSGTSVTVNRSHDGSGVGVGVGSSAHDGAAIRQTVNMMNKVIGRFVLMSLLSICQARMREARTPVFGNPRGGPRPIYGPLRFNPGSPIHPIYEANWMKLGAQESAGLRALILENTLDW